MAQCNETKVDFSKPIETRGGQKVEIITMEGRGNFPIIGYRGDNAGVSTWSLTGSFSYTANDFDLVNSP